MDQESFRSLLGTSAPPVASTQAARTSILPSRKATKPTTSAPSNQTPAGDSSSFKPRKFNSKFRDRAAERRDGINEYAEVEGILEDFEKRNAGADRTVVEEERKYLGGDEEHTILVKGLDFALLEQNKARVAAVEDAEAEAALEAAFSGEPLPSGPPATASPPVATPEAVASTKPRRSREERIADLKRKRDATRTSAPTTSSEPPPPSAEDIEKLERAKKMGKFRPIGAPPPEVKKKDESAEKRRKKKRKVVVEAPASSAIDANAVASNTTPASKSAISSGSLNTKTSKSAPLASTTKTVTFSTPPNDVSTSSPAPNALLASVQPPLASTSNKPKEPKPKAAPRPTPTATNDSDSDIFAGAGSYQGFGSGSDSNDSDLESESGSEHGERRKRSAGKERARSPDLDKDRDGDVAMGEGDGAAPKMGRWFGENDPDIASFLPAAPARPSVTPLSGSKSKPLRSGSHSRSPSPSQHRSDDSDDETSNRPMRLQPLSSSAVPSVKDILEMDKQAEAEDKRKARKAKYKAASGGGEGGTGEVVEKAPKKKLDKDQKLNRDFQQYTTYVEKKSKGDGGK